MSATRKPTGGGKRQPWYASGLEFDCVPECGACCTRHGDYAYVYLSEDDTRRLADHLDLDPRAFLNEHTVIDDGDVVLKMVEPECPFLDGWRCTVYEARPVQCRTFPFWPEHLKSSTAWRDLAAEVPGIGRGRRHGEGEIRRRQRESKRSGG